MALGAPLPLTGAPPPEPVAPQPSGTTAFGSGFAAQKSCHVVIDES